MALRGRELRGLGERAAREHELGAAARQQRVAPEPPQLLLEPRLAQQRLHRAECTADDSPICRYCDAAEETQEHIMWYCSCWAPQRRPLEILISAPQWDSLPPHTRHCGLFEEDPTLLELQAELANDPMPQPVPRPAPDTGDDEWHSYLDPDGSYWVYAATDGACTNQAHPLLARAGFGVYYYNGHRLNHCAKVHGLSQTAQRAETLALVHLVSTAERPVHIFIDNQAVHDTFARLLQGDQPPTKGEQADLWTRVHRAVHFRLDMFRVEKVASHLGEEGINQGRITVMAEHLNNEADKLATAAAALHNIPDHTKAAAKQRLRQAVTFHAVAVNIFDKRASTRPLPHRRAGYTDAELRRLDPHPSEPRSAPLQLGAPQLPLSDAEAALLLQGNPADADHGLNASEDYDPLGLGGALDNDLSEVGQALDPALGIGADGLEGVEQDGSLSHPFDDYDPFDLGGSLDNPPDPPAAPAAERPTGTPPPSWPTPHPSAQVAISPDPTAAQAALGVAPDPQGSPSQPYDDYDPFGLGGSLDNPSVPPVAQATAEPLGTAAPPNLTPGPSAQAAIGAPPPGRPSGPARGPRPAGQSD